jgi:hypothetical protein
MNHSNNEIIKYCKSFLSEENGGEEGTRDPRVKTNSNLFSNKLKMSKITDFP